MARMHRPKKLPKCPVCGSKNTVGKVMTVKDSGAVTTAYFCSSCLTEWNDKGTIRRPMYA